MVERRVIIRATGDASEATAALDGLSARGVAIGTALGNLAAQGVTKLIEGVGGLVSEAGRWITASNEQESATASLNAALHASGTFTQGLSDEYHRLAEAFQAATNVADDKLLVSMGKLVSVGGVQRDQMREATQAALDLAAGLQVDVSSAFDLVAKAASGHTEALSRYGLETKKGADAGEKFADVLEQIREKFGGMAEAEAATFEGQLESINVTIGDTREVLGDALKEGLEPFAEQAALAAKQLQAFVTEHKADIVIEFAQALQLLSDAALLGVQGAGALRESWASAKVGFAEFMEFEQPVIDGLRDLAKEAGAEGLAEQLGFLSDGLQANTLDQKANADEVRASVDAINEQAQTLRDKLSAALDETIKKSQDAADGNDALADSHDRAGAAARGAAEEAEAAADKLLKSLGFISQANVAKEIQAAKDAMAQLREEGVHAGPVYEKLAKHMADLEAKAKASGNASSDLAKLRIEAQAGANAGAEAERTFAGLGRTAREAGDSGGRAFSGFTASTKEADEAGRRYITTLQDMVAETQRLEEEQKKARSVFNPGGGDPEATPGQQKQEEVAAALGMGASFGMGIGSGTKSGFGMGDPRTAGIMSRLESMVSREGPHSAIAGAVNEFKAQLQAGDLMGAEKIVDAIQNQSNVAAKMGLGGADRFGAAAFGLRQALGEANQVPDDLMRLAGQNMKFVPRELRGTAQQVLRDVERGGLAALPEQMRGAVEAALAGKFDQMISALQSLAGLMSRPSNFNIDGKAVGSITAPHVARELERNNLLTQRR